MCGIFAWISKTDRGPDLDTLAMIATVTESRGRHAFGLAWTTGGAIETFKRPGAATDNLQDLDRCRDAVAMIGHCRLATHGSPDDNANNHPHQAGKGWLVHNGVVYRHNEIARHHGLHPQTECDSEVLGLLLGNLQGKLLARAAQMASEAQGDLAVLGLWCNPTRLLVVRDSRPLHYGETRDGIYFASLPEGLPGRVWAVRDHAVLVVTTGDQGLQITSRAIVHTAAPHWKKLQNYAQQRLLFA